MLLGYSRGKQIDHINGDRLDNRRHNLRFVTLQQNLANRKVFKNNKSGFKGVGFDKHSGKWRARISHNKRSISIIYTDNPIRAARAYNKVALELYGSFARLNEI